MIPRLTAQGADLSKIRILDGFTEFRDGEEVGEKELTLQAVDQIRDAIRLTERETGEPVRLVVVDPVSNHWGGVKENSNAEVRQVLKPIQRLAEETETAFLLITHFGKAIKEESADKVIGSIAITAVARTVWYLYRDKNRKDYRYFVPSKDNILVDPTGVEFMVNRHSGGRVEIIDTELEKHADDIEAEQFAQMMEKRSGRGRKPKQSDAAVEWLQNFLADGRKPVGNRENPAPGSVRFEAKQAGHSGMTIERASTTLCVVKRKEMNVWFWSLPVDENQVYQEENSRYTSNSDTVENLINNGVCGASVSSVSILQSTGDSDGVDLLDVSDRTPETTDPVKPAASQGPVRHHF